MATPHVTEFTPELTEIASGLDFPEGPIAMPDGSIVLVEMFGPRLTRVHPDGRTTTIAEIPGGPNGAAVGPDGAFYVCNNGGSFSRAELAGLTLPGGFDRDGYLGGRIQRVDPHDGSVVDLDKLDKVAAQGHAHETLGNVQGIVPLAVKLKRRKAEEAFLALYHTGLRHEAASGSIESQDYHLRRDVVDPAHRVEGRHALRRRALAGTARREIL